MIRILLPLACAALAACSAGRGATTSAARSTAAPDSTVIVLVRHAEKASSDTDPPLSAAGQARARALADAVRPFGVSGIFVTQYQRTQATAAPLASALRIVPDTFNTRAEGHPQAVANAARAHRGGALLVVGHSNSVPAIINALGAGPVAELCETEYANLFVVVLKEGATPRLERRTYGQADPPGASTCPR